MRSRLAIIAVFAFSSASIPSPVFAFQEQATGPKKECVELSGGQLFGDGVAFDVRNVCDHCIRFAPRVRLPDGAYMPVASSGAIVLSMKLEPNAQATLLYTSRQAGQSVPVMTSVREC